MVQATAARNCISDPHANVVSPLTGTVLLAVADVLRGEWCRDTSADRDRWSSQNPSYGQCAVTSLIVQDLFGGSLLRAKVNGTTHYWNRLPSGEEVDLTREQFGRCVEVPPGEERERDYVLSFPDTARRYEALAESVRRVLAND